MGRGIKGQVLYYSWQVKSCTYSEQTWGEAFLCFVFVCVCIIMEANYPGMGLWTPWMDCLHFSGFCQFRHMSWVRLATPSRRSKLIQQGVTSQFRLKRLPGWSVLSLQREFYRDNCLCVCFWLEKTGCAQVSYFSVPCKPSRDGFTKVCMRQNSSGLWSREKKRWRLGTWQLTEVTGLGAKWAERAIPLQCPCSSQGYGEAVIVPARWIRVASMTDGIAQLLLWQHLRVWQA